MSNIYMPTLTEESGFFRYLQEIKDIPSLAQEEEYMLAKRLKEHQDISAAHKLVASHLKLVAKIAFGFKGYGLPITELVSEGNLGLMHAVKKFDPELGFRLSTYAVWWIKASIQEYILRSWSLVKIGTTAAQKKLFFNLNKIRNRIYTLESRTLNNEDIANIAQELNVTEQEVNEMDSRIRADVSLNSMIYEDGNGELIDLLPETRTDQETIVIRNNEMKQKKAIYNQAMTKLDERERYIIAERRLNEQPTTLQKLSEELKISCERVRQLENKAIKTLTNEVQRLLGQVKGA
jgi:RNA polymerase sigma-32 factor